MQPSIPIPTDNIYKFACLLGLAIFISAMLGSIYMVYKFDELTSKDLLELEALKAKDNLSLIESTQKVILEKKYKSQSF